MFFCNGQLCFDAYFAYISIAAYDFVGKILKKNTTRRPTAVDIQPGVSKTINLHTLVLKLI